jgi:iron complex outermembrane receptor protein
MYVTGGVNLVFEQDHPSIFETATNAYQLVNLGLGFDLKVEKQLLNFRIAATNLLNVDYYDHLSTLKDLGIYNMGRNISISVKVPFTLKN